MLVIVEGSIVLDVNETIKVEVVTFTLFDEYIISVERDNEPESAEILSVGPRRRTAGWVLSGFQRREEQELTEASVVWIMSVLDMRTGTYRVWTTQTS